MRTHANPPRSRWTPALALCATLAVPATARADFEVTYLFTDSDGQALSDTRLTGTQMGRYVNQASCECGDPLAVRVYLNNNVGTPYNANDRVYVYVGTSCSDAQNVNSNYDPCVQLNVGPASEFDDLGKFLVFDQVWLSSGATMINQDISVAQPIAPCPGSQTGTGKIWICVDADGNSQCLSDEFVTPTILNTTDTNGGTTTDGMDGGQQVTSDGISYDYLPPQNTLSGFRSSPGDGRVEIHWDQAEVNDISGYRVLCADSSGAPVKDGIDHIPTGQARTNGTLYYTADNLCEMPMYMSEPGPPPMPDPRPDDPGTGGSSGAMGLDEDWQGDGWSLLTTTGDMTTGDVTTGGDMTTGGTGPTRSTESSDGTGGTGGTSGTGTGGEGTAVGCESSTSPLCDLDWAYVCSSHQSPQAVSAEVNGLRNGETYQFLVVAYDPSGNPKIMSPILTAIPIETTDFWEQCEQQGDLCGNGGFCHCRAGASPSDAWLGTGLLLLLLARRRPRPSPRPSPGSGR